MKNGNAVENEKDTWKIKIYVGEFHRFVLCEMFPDDEKHIGMDTFLEFLVTEDECVVPSGTKKGFYIAHLKMESGYSYNPLDDECYLVIDELEPIAGN